MTSPSVSNRGGNVLWNTSVFNSAEATQQIISLHKNGKLETPKDWVIHIPTLERLTNDQRFSIFIAQNEYGATPLHRNRVVVGMLVPCLLKMDPESLFLILSVQTMNGNTPMHRGHTMELAPLLTALSESQAVILLTTLNHAKMTPLHDYSTVLPLCSFLSTLSFPSLLKTLSTWDANGNTPVHNAMVVARLINLLKTLSHPQLLQVLSLQNEKGSTPLHNEQVVEELFPLIKPNPHQLLLVSDKDGKTVFQNDSIVTILIDNRILEIKNLVTILLQQKKDNDYAALVDRTIDSILELFERNDLAGRYVGYQRGYGQFFDEVRPLLEECSVASIIRLVSGKQDEKGDETLLYYRELVDPLIPYLEKLLEEQLVDLLCLKPIFGISALHLATTVDKLLPLLRKLSIQNLIKVFTIKDYGSQKIPLESPAVLEALMPIFCEGDFPFQDLIQILSLKNHSLRIFWLEPPLVSLLGSHLSEDIQVKILCHFFFDSYKIEMLMPWFEKISPSNVTLILKVKAVGGDTYLHCSRAVNTLLPVLKRLSSDDLKDVSSIPNDEGKTPLDNPTIASKLQPLLSNPDRK